MFKHQIEATLKSVQFGCEDEWRTADCVFHVPMDYGLARELSPVVAARLFMVKDVHPNMVSEGKRVYRMDDIGEFVPCPDLKLVRFDGDVLVFEPQKLEIRATPDVPVPGGTVPGVDIYRVEGLKQKGASEMILALHVRAKFMPTQIPVLGKLLIGQLGQTCWLQFTAQQSRLQMTDAQDAGATINEKAKASRQ